MPGSDDYRYEGGRVCDNRPVRADFLDDVVWGQVTALLADPTLVQAELDRRLAELRAANPATAERSRIELELTRTTTAIARLLEAYQEALLSLDELRARMPALRTKEAGLRASANALEAQVLDRDAYLKLAEDLEGFLGRLQSRRRATAPPSRTASECYAAWSRRSSSAPSGSSSGTRSPPPARPKGALVIPFV